MHTLLDIVVTTTLVTSAVTMTVFLAGSLFILLSGVDSITHDTDQHATHNTEVELGGGTTEASGEVRAEHAEVVPLRSRQGGQQGRRRTHEHRPTAA